MAEAYLINPISPSRSAKGRKGGIMARRRRRKLYGAALRSWRKARRKCRHHSNSPDPRRRHHRRRYRCNQALRMPRMPGMGQAGKTIMDSTFAVLTVGWTLMVTNWIAAQIQRTVPGVSGPWAGIAVKIGAASLVVWGANQVIRDPGLRKVALAGAAFVPVSELIGRFVPQVAAALPAPILPKIPGLGMPPGDRLSDYTLDAALEAELQQENERGNF